MSSKKFRVAIATGGTGGHIFPGLAIADQLHDRGHKTLILADKRFLNYKNQFPSYLNYKIIPSGSFAGGTLRKIVSTIKIFLGVIKALLIYYNYKPNIVIGFGGYTCFPSIIAAKIMHIPIFIHEQNAVVGKTNRLLMKLADVIAVTFKDTVGIKARDKRVEIVGNPVRKQILQCRKSAYKSPSLKTKVNILITGGSQGAAIFSKVIPKAIALLDINTRHDILITQQCRIEDMIKVKQQYSELGIKAVIAKFFDDMPKLLSESHIIVSRAGASIISEIMAIGRPAIFIPIEKSSGNHQYINAKTMEDSGAAWIIKEPEFSAETCAALLQDLLNNKTKKLASASINARALYSDAGDRLTNMILNFCQYGHV